MLTRKLFVELFRLEFSHQKLKVKIYFMNRIPTLRIPQNGVLDHFNATSMHVNIKRVGVPVLLLRPDRRCA